MVLAFPMSVLTENLGTLQITSVHSSWLSFCAMLLLLPYRIGTLFGSNSDLFSLIKQDLLKQKCYPNMQVL
jgi:xanthine/uracil permease